MVRADFEENKRPRYSFVSSKKYGGAGPGAPVHVPLFTGDKTTVRVTEGVLKSDISTALGGVLTLGLPGVSGLRRLVPVLRSLKATTIRVAFDADASRNIVVATALIRVITGLKAEGFAVQLERWAEADGKGLDDLLAAGKTPELVVGDDVLIAVQEIVATAQAASPTAAQVADRGRPIIFISTEERTINDSAVAALTGEPDLYTRGGLLVRVLRDADRRGLRRVRRTEGAPRISLVEEPTLREILAGRALWMKVNGLGDVVRAHPPVWCVAAVACRGTWPSVRYLAGVVECPSLRPDGSVIDQPGWDEDTGLLFEPDQEFPPVPERPTQEDARAAAEKLLALVSDFPFTGAAQRAAWVSAFWTPIARPAIDGPCPMHSVEASCPGAGKTLLADLIGRIVTGRDLPRE